MESLKFVESRQLGKLLPSFTTPIKQSWRLRSDTFQPKQVRREVTEICSFDSTSFRLHSDGSAYMCNEDGFTCKLELGQERFVSITEIDRQLLFVTQTHTNSQISLHLCEDGDILLDAASCSTSFDLTKLTVQMLANYQVYLKEIICIDRNSGTLIVRKQEKIWVLDAFNGRCSLEVKISEESSVNYASGYLSIWWLESVSTKIRHINLKTLECTCLAVCTEERLVLCIPTANCILLKAPSSSVTALSLDGSPTELGAVSHIYISESDGDCIIVQRDGEVYSLNNPSLSYKLRSPRVKCLASGAYLFIASQHYLQVLCRATMKELARANYRETSKASCLFFNKEREELWISDSRGRFGIFE
mmetsp:Transcript_25597/g.44679  ORF Transcript_25597/g.44679 Transcript_25597/m.44679 type:complete len:361 (-) Transcript_25597:9952-11034(-)